MKLIVCAVTVLAVAAGVGVARASGPIAVYALVDKVDLEPNSNQPERIRISGVFITAQERTDVYSAPQRGYVYFALPKQHVDLARREWSDLKSLAGTRQVVGFGSSWNARLRVRMPNDPATSPDEYPMGSGLVKVNADQPRAKALLDHKDR